MHRQQLMKNGKPLKFKWTVGIVTSPRPLGHYINRTLSSLLEAGWDDPHVFAEPDSPIPPELKGPLTFRPHQYGDWTNWATAFYELLLSRPDTDYFLMSEDDALYKPHTKEYIEAAIPFLGEFASLSLYTPMAYHKDSFSGFHNECHDWETWSTVSVVMSREKAISFFSNEMVQRHRFDNILADQDVNYGCKVDPRNSIKDAVIGRWAYCSNLPIYYHTPSFVQHIGKNSTIASDLVEEKGQHCCEDHAFLEPYVFRTDRSSRIALL